MQLVYLLRPLPARPSAAVAQWSRSAGGEAAVQVAAQLAVGGRLDLVLTPPGRPCASLAADLTRRGVAASAAEQPPGAIVVAPMSTLVEGRDCAGGGRSGADEPAVSGARARRPDRGSRGDRAAAHLGVVAGAREGSDDMDHWVPALTRQPDSSSPDTSSSSPDSSSPDSSSTDSQPGTGQQESRQP